MYIVLKSIFNPNFRLYFHPKYVLEKVYTKHQYLGYTYNFTHAYMHDKQTQNFQLRERDFPEICPQSIYDESFLWKKVIPTLVLEKLMEIYKKILMIAFKHTQRSLWTW